MNTKSAAACVTGIMLRWREGQGDRDPGRAAPDIVKMVKIIDRSIEPAAAEADISEIFHLLKKIDQNVQKIGEQKSER